MKALTSLFLLVFLVSFSAFGGRGDKTKSIHTPVGGSPVQLLTSTAKDTISLDPLGSGQQDYNVLDRVSFGVDLQYPEFVSSNQKVQVSMLVKQWDVNNNPLPDLHFKLNIDFNHADTAKSKILDSYEFTGAYRVFFQIDTIRVNGTLTNILPKNLFVQTDLFVERYTTLAATPVVTNEPVFLDIDCNLESDGIKLSWQPLTGAEEYQLEFVHVSNYGAQNTVLSASLLAYDFKHNSTRISTSNLSYELPLIFDRGWLVYRIRPVGVDITNPDHLIMGDWDISQTSGTIQSIGTTNKKEITAAEAHFKELNWQYSATYAEQGKRKEVISYFDGTLRNRQSVTKVNTEKNVIVGETLYDHQGRPAVQVLPTPVNVPTCGVNDGEPVIQYYDNFNRNMNGIPYSKTDFDVDNGGEGATCAANAAGMDTSSGASQYYSPNNPDQTLQQAYVPDAQGFPFTQIVYTPDNTGRVSSQSGVGPDFQIGTNKETRYLYSNPNQVELNRMFGSEVGYAEHYQKNMVIDPNGQVSVSYIDMAGRVVATALAGEQPANLEPLSLPEFDSISNNHIHADGSNQTIDYLSNKVTFSTSFTVSSPTLVGVNYQLITFPLADTCLDGICVDCIYELELSLKDECGIDLLSDTLQNQLIGSFTRDTLGNLVFLSSCPDSVIYSAQNSVNLPMGKYTLSKEIQVLEEAVQAYVNLVDSSDCILTYQDFLDAEMAQIDSSICAITCDNCLEELGTLQNFVSNGIGTAQEYYQRVEDCQELCKDKKTDCEIYLSTLKIDMSPGGQYAEYRNPSTGATDLSGPLSILNTSNILPQPSASWRLPILETPNGTLNIYADENGIRSRIVVEEDPLNPGAYLPAPVNNNMVQYDATLNHYYIYPEQLNSVLDFVDLFELSWANSLVKYHPEYCYYESCISYEDKHALTDAFSSASFDNLLYNTNSFAAAQANGFIDSQGEPTFWFAPTGNNPLDSLKPWDPFVFYHGDFETPTCDGYWLDFMQKFGQYEFVSGEWHSMPEIAAYTARCGSNLPSLPDVDCYNFGQLYNGVTDTAVLNMEWSILKALYMSTKQEYQQALATCKAIRNCDSYNACIGDEGYVPHPLFGFFPTGPSSYYFPFWDQGQPCSVFSYILYRNKTKRFPNHDDAAQQDANSTSYNIYLQTGQCPTAFTLQYLLNELATSDHLTSGSYNLNLNTFLSGLFQASNSFYNPGNIPALTYEATVGTNTITADWKEGGTTFATLTLNKSASQNWADVTGVTNLFATGEHTFTAEATYFDTMSHVFSMTGSLTYFELDGCTFEQECSSNQLALDLTTAMNVLLLDGNFAPSSPVNLTNYASSFMGNTVNLTSIYIENASNTGSNLMLETTTSGALRIYDASVMNTDGLYLNFADLSGPFSSQGYFGTMTSTSDYSFEMEYVENGAAPVLLSGVMYQIHNGDTIGISAGECDLPTPANCQGPAFEVFEDLKVLLADELVNYNGTNTIDLYSSIYTTPEIVGAFPYGDTATTSIDADSVLTISSGNCDLVLTLNTSPYVQFDNISSVGNFELTGELDNQSGYTHFICVASFNTPSGLVYDTIHGSTCFTLKECKPCSDTASLGVSFLAQMGTVVESVEEFDQLTVGNNEISAFSYSSENSFTGMVEMMPMVGYDSVTCSEFYTNYLNAVTNFNENSNYPYDITPISQALFISKYCACVQTYNDLLDDLLTYHVPFANVNDFNAFVSIDNACNSCPEYYDYLEAVGTYNSTTATYLIQDTMSSGFFNAYGLCNCTAAFIDTLESIVANNISFATQGHFDNYSSIARMCSNDLINVTEDPCKTAYSEYLVCTRNFLTLQSTYTLVYFTYEVFDSLELCNCMNNYCAALDAVINGLVTFSSQTEFDNYILGKMNCIQRPPCTPQPTSGIFPEMPEVELENDCIAMQVTLATVNAQNAYNQYIDSVNSITRQKYLDHCLQTQEKLLTNYRDKQHHYMLYYYDLAGNLIKTVPPAGVELLDITSDTDPLNVQINNDRTQGLKTVFTTHRLETKYEYNSLNQLVAQSSPDMDPMTGFEQTLPNGLNSQLITRKIQMVTETNGYLVGEIGNRGYLYKTQDGGQSWSRVTNLVSADLKKMVMIDANYGVAVGEAGTILKTVDGGQNWDLVISWGTSGMIQTINDVAVLSSSSILFVGDNGLAAHCTNFTSATPAFTLLNSGLNGNDVLSVEVVSGSYFCTTYNPSEKLSRFYQFNGSSWVELSNASTLNFTDVDYYDTDKAYGSDLEGRIYANTDITNSSSRWVHRSSNLSDTINSIRFFDQNQGIALVEKDGKRQVYRTIDGAQNWAKLSDTTYEAMSISKDRNVIAAVGENKHLAIIFPYLSGQDHLVDVVAPNGAGNLTAVSVTKTTTGAVQLIVSNDQTIFYTQDATVAQPVWQQFSYSGIADPIIQLEAHWVSGSTIYGVAVTETGQAVRLRRVGTAYIEALSTLIASSGINKVSLGDQRFYLSNVSGTSCGSVALDATTTNTSIGNLPFSSTTIQARGTSLVAANATGNSCFVTLNGTGSLITSTIDYSNKVYADKLNVLVKDEAQNKLLAFGNDGLVYHWDAGTSTLKRILNRVNEHIYDAQVNASTVYFVGQNGLAKKGTLTSYTSMASTDLMMTTGNTVLQGLPTTDLNAVAVTPGQRIYIAGNNGTLLYSPAVSGVSGIPLSLINQGNMNLSCIAKKSSSENVLIGGEQGHVQQQFGAATLVNNNVFIPGITDVHFKDGSLGSIVAKNYVVRTTGNGGGSWEIGRPQGTQNPVATYKFVWTLSSGEALLFGNGSTLKANTNTGTTSVAFAATNILTVSKGTNPQNIYVVDGTTVKRIDLNSTFTQTTVNTVSSGVNALHVFGNGDYIVVGNAGLYQHYTAAGAPLTYPTGLSSANFRDIAFFDNLSGIIVGDNGTYYRNASPVITTNGFMSACTWQARNLTTTDPLSVALPPIYTIELASATTILVGGENPASASTAAYPYVRHIYDEGSRYTNHFYYDRLGRIVVSRNARQEADNLYSYTLYDELGRVYEAGEKQENPGAETNFRELFGTIVNGYFSPVTMDDTRLTDWISGTGTRSQVTRSYYDTTYITGLPSALTSNPVNMRLRIMHVTYEETYDADDQTFDHATHYNYDIHGNVKLLVHDNQKMAVTYPSLASQRFKQMEYSYDLLSGNVHRMSVQAGQADQWHHAYTYDADNRIRKVYTNTHEPLTKINRLTQNKENELSANADWQNDAQYYYYAHGPLARVEVGQNNLQGVDYYYNLQGWLKGVNSSVLEADENAGDRTDPGQDSDPDGVNAYFAKDVFGFGLHYYEGDYAAISGATPEAPVNASSHAGLNSSDLYNGNIRYMQTAITHPETHAQLPMLNAYKYDQLNRLKESRSYENGLSGGEWRPDSYTNSYYNEFSYDAMGNILFQKRHKRDGTRIEDLTYRYHLDNTTNKLVRNRLYHVNDSENASLDSTDIDDMGPFYPASAVIATSNNYRYDAEGRLVHDTQEEIERIVWRVDGKVKEIQRMSTSVKNHLRFDYDAMGHRVAKHEYTNAVPSILKKSTYYVLDAQGNQLSMYEHKVEASEVHYFLEERNLYGSSRLGTLKEQVDMMNPEPMPSYGQLGLRNYEFSNHLGNVLAVINDHIAPLDENSDGDVDGYRVAIDLVFDYSPFGVMLDGRSTEKIAPMYDTTYIENIDTVYLSNFTTGAWTQPFYDNWKAETNDVSLGITGATNRLRVESTDANDGVIRDFTTQAGHEYRVTFNVTDASTGAYFKAYSITGGVPTQILSQALTAGSTATTYSFVVTPNATGMRLKFHEGGVFTLDDIVITDTTLTDVHFTDLESPTYVAPVVDGWNYDPSVAIVYNASNADFIYPNASGLIYLTPFVATSGLHKVNFTANLLGTNPSRKAQLHVYSVNSSGQLTGLVATLGDITASGNYAFNLPTLTVGSKYTLVWTGIFDAAIKLTVCKLIVGSTTIYQGHFSSPVVIKPSWDGWTIDTQTQLLRRVTISSNNVLIAGVQRTYTGTTAGAVYRFRGDVNYVSYPSTGIPSTGSTQDSLIIYSVNSGGALTRLKAVRYNLLTGTVPVSLTFTAPVGSVSIQAVFKPGNAGLASGRVYVVDNLRLTRMTGTNLYTSNFVSGSIVSQNTDGWSANWATAYMNVLTGSPNKLRVAGETPVIQRNFPVSPNDDYELTYTQSENNSLTFTVEQSPNGTSGWTSLVNTTSMNGTQTKYFTPTEAFVRVRYSGSAAYSLANMKLVGIDVDTLYTLIARGSYRYAFNGMEKDDELKGAGNSYDFGARMHDPRLGRFFSLDPKASAYPFMSSYCYAANNPIYLSDKNGEGPIIGWKVHSMAKDDKTKTYTITYDITVTRDITLVNQSTLNLTVAQGLELAKSIAQQWANSDFSYSFAGKEAEVLDGLIRPQYGHIPKDYKLVFNVNVNFVAGKVSYLAQDDASKINDESTLIGIRDDLAASGEVNNPAGLADSKGAEACVVEASYISPRDVTTLDLNFKASNVSIHELLHLDGADDTYTKTSPGIGVMGSASRNFSLAPITKYELGMNLLIIARQAHNVLLQKPNMGNWNNWIVPITKPADYQKNKDAGGTIRYNVNESTNGESLQGL
ncbi:RHS repeat-associated core domain-containing protein [Fluviicola chungangensis]|nr:RHS repeat-associated core domain-containing protein [Fluviicola chungangensis]